MCIKMSSFSLWPHLPYDIQSKIQKHMGISERIRFNMAICKRNTAYENEVAIIALGIRKNLIQKEYVVDDMYAFLLKHCNDYAVQELIHNLGLDNEISIKNQTKIKLFTDWCRTPIDHLPTPVEYIPSLEANPSKAQINIVGCILAEHATPRHFDELFIASSEFKAGYMNNIELVFSSLNYENIPLFIHLTKRKYWISAVMRDLENVCQPVIASMFYERWPVIEALIKHGQLGKPAIDAVYKTAISYMCIETARNLLVYQR